MNWLWIAAITIFVCAVMVKGPWVQTGPVLHQAPADKWAILGLVGFITGYCKKKIVCETPYTFDHFSDES